MRHALFAALVLIVPGRTAPADLLRASEAATLAAELEKLLEWRGPEGYILWSLGVAWLVAILLRRYVIHSAEQTESRLDDLVAALDRVVAANGRPPKFIYSVPDFSNPTGACLRLDRRQLLVETAAELAFKFAGETLTDQEIADILTKAEPMEHRPPTEHRQSSRPEEQ